MRYVPKVKSQLMDSTFVDTLPWRLNVGFIILNNASQVWMGRRTGLWNTPWQFPQGGIDQGECPEQAMWRELKEEVGLKDCTILSVYPHWLSYKIPVEQAIQQGFQGQKQQWYLLLYQGCDDIIQINSEFCQWAWVPWTDLEIVTRLMVAPFKRHVYMALLESPFKDKAIKRTRQD